MAESDVERSSVGFDPRRYRQMINADLGATQACRDCGSAVIDPVQHDAFHRRLSRG